MRKPIELLQVVNKVIEQQRIDIDEVQSFSFWYDLQELLSDNVEKQVIPRAYIKHWILFHEEYLNCRAVKFMMDDWSYEHDSPLREVQ